jgi:multiple sugar transport system permease protein
MPWAGLSNFAALLDDGVFWLSLRHTFAFAAVSVVLEVVLELGTARIPR